MKIIGGEKIENRLNSLENSDLKLKMRNEVYRRRFSKNSIKHLN